MDLEPNDVDPSLQPAETQRVSSLVNIELQGQVLDRVGMAGQVVGAFGIAVWGFLAYVAVDGSRAPFESASDWKVRAIQILSPITVLLFSMMVIALSSACRVLAGWSSVRVEDEFPDDEDEEPSLDDGELDSR